MKTRLILFVAITAITTLSFTFASINSNDKAKIENQVKDTSSEPVGGFIAEDQI